MTAASNWIIPVSVRPLASGNERSSPEMTPADSEPTRPSGFPTAKASSPIWALPPSTSGTITDGSWLAVSTAMSWAGSEDLIEAAEEVPSAKVTLMADAALDDVERGEDVALGVDDDPGAEVLGARRTLRLDHDQPGPSGAVHLGRSRWLGLQLGDRRVHLLVDDAVDVLRADRGSLEEVCVQQEEGGKGHNEGQDESATQHASQRPPSPAPWL